MVDVNWHWEKNWNMAFEVKLKKTFTAKTKHSDNVLKYFYGLIKLKLNEL